MATRKIFITGLFILVVGFIGSGCALPPTQPYPYESDDLIRAEAQQISDTLEGYIRDWMAGRVPAEIPISALPPGIYTDENDPNFNNISKPHRQLRGIRLAMVGSIDRNVLSWYRAAEVINYAQLKANNPDPHYTYIWGQGIHLAPFGSTTVLEGDFPHCRFMQITPTAPLNGVTYNWSAFGPPENPIIDADIEPDPGHVNPFRVGANRYATNRHFHIYLQNRIDNVGIAPDQYAPKPPTYRSPGNLRYASGIVYKGPGLGGPPDGVNPLWGAGTLWIRYALPDNYGKPGFDPLCGAGLPLVYHQLSTGEKFHIVCDIPYLTEYMNKTFNSIAQSTAPASNHGESYGWTKMWGILNAMAWSMKISLGQTANTDKQYVKDLIKGVEGRGADMPAPGNWEGSATCVNYCNYLCRGMNREDGKVSVLTGKRLSHPKTMNGQSIMTGGQIRYWSICSYETDFNYSQTNDGNERQPAPCVSTICDEELVVDANNNYILCFSRVADRPTNATSSARVTWVNWGNHGSLTWTTRWISIAPDWAWSKTPDEVRLPWKKTDETYNEFDRALLGQNVRTGWLGEYQPKVNYMSKSAFESMGTPVTWAKVDAKAWNASCGASMQIERYPSRSILLFVPLLFGIVLYGCWWIRKR